MYKLIFRAVRLSIHSCENIDKRKSSLRRGWLKSSWAGSIMRPIQGDSSGMPPHSRLC